MNTVENQTFEKEDVAVDGKSFIGCTFNRATLIFGAGEVPKFANCEFTNITLDFDGAADNTLKFLSSLYQSGFPRSVERLFDTIRSSDVGGTD